ncbi:serine hydrolase [uncultured Microscilla sp.]|uniref:serine hydrolase n=1 Tax=uncultured Microscilla sp. TaxID=432653 RepID=UPI002634F93F|nr:serine hydrolase [uncultured Microscilla sp.]
MKILILFVQSAVLLCCMGCSAQSNKSVKSNLIDSLMKSQPDAFRQVLQNSKVYELQVMYTQINRDTNNTPSFKTYQYNVDKNRYFYPASLVKLPVACLTLEKLNKLKIKGLNKYTVFEVDSVRAPQTPLKKDTTTVHGKPFLAQMIKRAFVVSDNKAFNRLYEFLGQKYINESLWQKGYYDIMVQHRLANSDFNEVSNRYTNPFKFYKKEKVIYEQKEAYNDIEYLPKVKQPFKGVAHINKEGEKVNKPFNFSLKNYFSLETMHQMLKAVMFPASVSPQQRFDLTEADYQFLYKCMAMLPRESTYPVYNKPEHTDGFMKFLMYGDLFKKKDYKSKIPAHIRIFNKVGLSYGFLVDNAYVVDFKNNIEFMISVVIYVNNNQVLNDSKYQYKETGMPFMVNFGQLIYEYELTRSRKYKPDLYRFRVGR